MDNAGVSSLSVRKVSKRWHEIARLCSPDQASPNSASLSYYIWYPLHHIPRKPTWISQLRTPISLRRPPTSRKRPDTHGTHVLDIVSHGLMNGNAASAKLHCHRLTHSCVLCMALAHLALYWGFLAIFTTGGVSSSSG
jgi:hypothetical protein